MQLILLSCIISSALSFFRKVEDGDPFRCPRTPLWLSLHETVTRAYDFMEIGYFEQARTLLVVVSEHALADVSIAFECSIGISALHRALSYSYTTDPSKLSSPGSSRRASQIGLRMMHVAMNWLTHAFVKKANNRGEWVDRSSWPISIQAINDEETTIQQAIIATGAYGSKPVRSDIPPDFRDRKLRIGIVSVCDYPGGNPLPRLSRSNRQLYADKHGYTVIEEFRRFDESRPHAWAKITLLLAHIMSKEFDWLLWFDCDTYFMNFDITLDSILYRYGADQSGDGLNPKFKMLIQEDHAMLNTGVFFIKTGVWAQALLQRVYGPPTSPWIDHPWWENAAFSHEFLGNLAQRMLDGNISESDMDGIYPDGVLVSPQELFNSYHPITSRIFMHDTWEAGKFVLAFSGCKSGSSEAVVHELYENYYRIMCELNNVQSLCVQIQEA